MKKLLIFVLTLALIIACQSSRPSGNNTLTVKIQGTTILHGATVSVLAPDGVAVLGTTTSNAETGEYSISGITTLGNVAIKACNGKYYSEATPTAPVTWNGCLINKATVSDASATLTVDIDMISTLWNGYKTTPDTSKEELLAYLLVTSYVPATIDTTLTDAAKLYLFQEAISLLAKQISVNNSITPETSLSTEALFTLILADLADNNTIDGSTKALFGPTLKIDEALIRQSLIDALPSVSAKFAAADLTTWMQHLKTAEAKFLGTATGNDNDLIPDADSGTDAEGLYSDEDTIANPPAITITAPKKDDVLFGQITLSAQRTLESCPLVSLSCEMSYTDDTNQTKKVPLTDTDENKEVFTATLDTAALDLPDTQYNLDCTGSNGVTTAADSVKFTLSNKNEVQILAYIFEKMTGVTADIYNMSGTKIKSLTEETGIVKALLPPGAYMAKITTGEYTSLLFKDTEDKPKTMTLSTTLTSRFEVSAGSTTKVFVTPTTTLREIIYAGLIKRGAIKEKATTESLELFKTHYDSLLNPYAKPAAGAPGENGTLNYFAIAGLEALALEISERQGHSAGAVTLDGVINTLGADLIETACLFDGLDDQTDALKLDGFTIDSYFYRYYQGVAMKKFIEGNLDGKGWTIADFQGLISKVSMDTSELFPAADAPKQVVAMPPDIHNISYRRGSMTDYVNYVDPDSIPFVSGPFDLKFDATTAAAGGIKAIAVYYTETIPEISLSDLTATGDTYSLTAEAFPVPGADGEKILTLKAKDDQGNQGLKTIRLIKDTLSPEITKFKPVGDKTLFNASFNLEYAIAELNPFEFSYTVSKDTEVPGAAVSFSILNDTGELTPTIDGDGLYTFELTATDKAEFVKKATTSARIDATAPTASITIYTTENTPRTVADKTWINKANMQIKFEAVVERDNSQITYTYEKQTGTTEKETRTVTNTTKGYSDNQYLGGLAQSAKNDLANTKHTVLGWMKDEAGNESTKTTTEFYVDTVVPTLSVSGQPSTLKNSWPFTFSTSDVNMKEVWVEDNYNLNKPQPDIKIFHNISIGDQSLTFTCLDNSSTEGLHKIYFYAEDYAGNAAPVILRELTLDCTPPIINPKADGTNTPQNPLSALDDSKVIKSANFPSYTLWSSESNVTMTTTIRKDGAAAILFTNKTLYTGAIIPFSTLPFSLADDAIYVVEFSARDEAGNVSIPFSKVFVKDDTNPVITLSLQSILTAINPELAGTPDSIHFSVSDINIEYCNYTLNGGAATSIGTSDEFSLLNSSNSFININAENTFIFTCADKAGNISTKTYSFFYDTVPPTIELTNTDFGTIEPYPVAAYDGNHGGTGNFPIRFFVKTQELGQSGYLSTTAKIHCQYTTQPPIMPDNILTWDDCFMTPTITNPTCDANGECTATVYYQEPDYALYEGLHYIKIWAEDTAGNSGEGTSEILFPFTLDFTSPLVHIQTSANTGTVWHQNNPGWLIKTNTNGVKNYTTHVYAAIYRDSDGALIASRDCTCLDHYAACTNPWDAGDFESGFGCQFDSLPASFVGKVYFRATDNLGNGYSPSNPNFKSDCEAQQGTECFYYPLEINALKPEISVSIVDNANHKYIKAGEAIDFTITADNADTITCELWHVTAYYPHMTVAKIMDTDTCTSTGGSVGAGKVTSMNMSDGDYFVRVTGTNAAGSSVASDSLILDTHVPTINNPNSIKILNIKPYYRMGQDFISFSISASDAGGIKGISVKSVGRSYRDKTTGTLGGASSITHTILSDSDVSTTIYNNTLNIPASVFVEGGKYNYFQISVTDYAQNTSIVNITMSPANTLYILEASEKTEMAYVQSFSNILRMKVTRMYADTFGQDDYNYPYITASDWVNADNNKLSLEDYKFGTSEYKYCWEGSEFTQTYFSQNCCNTNQWRYINTINNYYSAQINFNIPDIFSPRKLSDTDAVWQRMNKSMLPDGAKVKYTDVFGITNYFALSTDITYNSQECLSETQPTDTQEHTQPCNTLCGW